MDDPVVIVLLTLAAVVALKLLVLLAMGGGSLARLGQGIEAFRKVLGSAEVAAKVAPLLSPPPPTPAKPPRLSGEPVRLLAILQRDGQLLDLLLEDVSGAGDAQLGAAVREVLKKSGAAIREHLTLERVLPADEGQDVTVPAGFDPSAIRVTGNVTGKPPFKGKVVHPGWRVKAYKLAAPPEGQDDLVVAPAEVELP